MDEKYDLKWKTYSDQLVGVFKDLGEEGHFADVTLVSDDQVQTPAHKVVLSACSPVLKTLLVNNPHSHPLLYLRGIQQTELQALLKFMYFGETQIFENRINDFVGVAKDLEVKEISEEQDENAEDEEQSNTYHEEETVNEESTITEEPAGVKSEQTRNTERSIARPRQKAVANSKGRFICDECEATFTENGSLTKHKQSKHLGVRYPCTECDYKATHQSNLTVHINSKHAGIRYPCTECPDRPSFTKKDHLKIHTESNHLGVRYPCTECDYEATQQRYLTAHINSKHEGIPTFNDRSNLKRHTDSKHLGVKYPCTECDYQATAPSNPRRHTNAKLL